MSNVSKRRREGLRTKIKSVGDHKEFLNRITKTLYYGHLPTLPCLSLPVTEISCEVWSAAQRGRSLRRLHADAAAGIARQACVSPCALVLALLYLERLNACNPDYLANAPPQDLFLISLMVGNKFLQDDGEDDEVICSEWAASGGIDLKQLKSLEMEFLNAIDWNVFVSDKSFEAGLSRLERQVAIRQAQSRGFFTYSDLVAACDGGAAELLHAAAATGTALAVYLAGLLALVASALLATHACLPATPATQVDLATNSTAEGAIDLTVDLIAADLFNYNTDASERLRCCASWARLGVMPEPMRPLPVAVRHSDAAPWHERTTLWNWLHRSLLVDPMQRWLGRIDEYAELEDRWTAPTTGCRWIDVSGLGAFMSTDR